MKFFTTSNSKNVIATLGIVTTERSELTFLLILYFHACPKCSGIILLGWTAVKIACKTEFCLIGKQIISLVKTFSKSGHDSQH